MTPYDEKFDEFLLNNFENSVYGIIEYKQNRGIMKLARLIWDNAASMTLEQAAERFEGSSAFNWVCSDGYSNGHDIGGELRYMASEIIDKKVK